MIFLLPLRDLTLFTGESPDTLSEDDVVARNRYRLEVRIAYNTGIVVARWAGTHAEYTKRMD